ncbi:MAG: hypothetical protein JSS53_03860, partial [Proteobacteria bacterium]|nr:hypothetical protein [Pseudomonadota bacterium]
MDFESLDLILQNTNDIIIAVDLNYTIQKISNSAIILFNLDKNKIVGENLLEIFKKNQISLPFPKNLETTFKSKKSLETNGLMNTKFGNRLVNWKIIALEHSNKISTALIFGCDLPDDQNISHLNLKTYFDNILFHLPCYVYWKDVHSIYLGCNNLFAKAAGLTSAEKIVGKTDYDLAWGKTEADLFRQGDREVLEGHSKLNSEEPQYQADATTKM